MWRKVCRANPKYLHKLFHAGTKTCKANTKALCKPILYRTVLIRGHRLPSVSTMQIMASRHVFAETSRPPGEPARRLRTYVEDRSAAYLVGVGLPKFSFPRYKKTATMHCVNYAANATQRAKHISPASRRHPRLHLVSH